MKSVNRFVFKSFRLKLMSTFVLLIMITSMGISLASLSIYSRAFYTSTQAYLQDMTNQTQINLNRTISSTLDITFSILSDLTIQEELRKMNRVDTTLYERQMYSSTIEDEIERMALYNDDIISLSVFNIKGEEISIKKNIFEPTLTGFKVSEIYAANGSAIWSLVGKNKDICVSRAIISLTTMKPIGYINIVYKRDYFDEAIHDISRTYSSGVYVLDDNGRIMVTNNDQYRGDIYPYDIEEMDGDRFYSVYEQTECYYYISEQFNNGWTMIATVPVYEYRKDVVGLYFAIGLLTTAIIIVIVIAYNIIAKRIAKPTEHLLEVMKEFGAGDLSQRVDVQTSDEIGQIGVEYNDMAKNIENLVNKVYLMELSQKEAEIEFLKMQINPHFLYNTLDTISWMSIMNGNEEVAEVSVSLAELLRANVKNDSFVTISDEIKTVKNYLSIQQHRFGDRIKVIYDIDSDIGDYYIPFFILQPLIENAIIHGLEPKVGEGFIKITVTKQNDDIFFSVFDDGVGMSQEEINAIYAGFEDDSVKKIGINNVYRRLTLRYGKQCGFQITSYPGAGTEIIFKLPINKMKNNKEVNQDEQ